ncbi:MAG: AAA family ATPase [Chitinophagales bacterium]
MIKIPFGVSDYEQMITQGYHYIDRTNYIEKMEGLGKKYLFFLRPRRFGKSLFLSSLQYYYGIEYKAKFEQLFEKQYIGQNPTPLANSYMILRLNFSGIDTETNEQAKSSFFRAFKSSVRGFVKYYRNIFDEKLAEIITNATDSPEILRLLFEWMKVNEVTQKIYLLIDEYDHFTNEILAFRFDEFKEIVGKNGWVRKFYESLKIGADAGWIDRMFITGVTPITLDSLTSGFNNASDISMRAGFEQMLGFTKEEVEGILLGIGISKTELNGISDDLKSWYDGYHFNQYAKKGIYNSEMVLYFADAYIERMEYPSQLLDTNIASDYSKIRSMFRIAHKEKENIEVLREVLKNDELKAVLTQKYNFNEPWDRDKFISLLYYLGFLTIKGSDLEQTIFTIPNYVIKELYFQYFTRVTLEEANFDLYNLRVRDKVVELAKYNNIKPIIELTESTLTQLSAHHDRAYFNEGHVKSIFVSWFHSIGIYHIFSELEVEKGATQKGRIDLLLTRRKPFVEETPYQFIFELKYLKQSEAKQLKDKKKEAIAQLKAYLKDEKIKEMTDLKAYVVIFVVNKATVVELKI